jgi:hypothetical protein
MGTNYYAVMSLNDNDKETAKILIENDNYDELKKLLNEKCGKIHIGKSSCGWKFLFNWNKGKYYNPLKASINDFLEQHRVVDEYGGEIALKAFWDMVESKQGGMDNEEYYKKYEEENNCRIGVGESYYNSQLAQYNPKFYEFYSDGLRFSTVTDFS